MGGGLTFLNKKTWHPGRMQNQEKLWKAEQEAAAEQRSLAELRKKIEEERNREDLKQAAIAGGHQKAADRLDWMYSGGMTAKIDADKRNEEAMLGIAPVPVQQETEKEVSRLEKATLLPSFYAEDTPMAANETWSRLHADPLFAIRQQEQSARKQVVANPVQMMRIKQQVEELKQQALAKKLAKKEAKAAKKAEKAAKKEKKSSKDIPLKAASPEHLVSRQQRDNSSGDITRRHHRDGPIDVARLRHEGDAEAVCVRERRDGISRDGSEGAHRRAGSHDRHERHSRHERSGADDHSRSIKRQRRARSPDRSHRDSLQNGHTHDGAARDHSRHLVDGASAQGGRIQYGLNANEYQGYDRSEAAAETRKRLEAAAKAKEEAERAAAAARHQRREYATGRLTEGEKAARLAEMTSTAALHEDTRTHRLKHAASQDAATRDTEGEAGKRHHTDAAKFMETAQKEIYGTAGSGGSLQDRVTRRKHYIDRKPSEGNAFRRG